MHLHRIQNTHICSTSTINPQAQHTICTQYAHNNMQHIQDNREQDTEDTHIEQHTERTHTRQQQRYMQHTEQHTEQNTRYITQNTCTTSAQVHYIRFAQI